MDGEPVCPMVELRVCHWCDCEQQRTNIIDKISGAANCLLGLGISEQMSTTVKGEVVQGYCST